ncbi:MAG: UDP-N-acetylglucosamine--N-acetylmuramyl-(pentapeptide) pyrophosphoryl-undecaprenol N-acetylglucosamine transferase [Candidatus Berkelbacteria bacterium]|nr:UDP-N-acetylglucosamine--N-acetylmuramyl-(pentapeptide) pyrophosphoryl-undecaprenol N-acetylglucosamine transferase [Candidatus Berkelbacteria bacterium]
MNKKTIFLVGADTGGHVVPVFALAQELSKQDNIRVVVIGVGSAIEKKFYSKLSNVEYKIITAGKFQFKNVWNNFVAVLKSGIGFFQSIGLIIKYQPKVIFLKGNYATVPVAYTARLFGVPILAHESDAIIGKSNRLITKFAKKLFVSYPIEIFNHPSKNLVYSGPILRPEYTEKIIQNHKKYDKPAILVLGGSQGAHAINEIIFTTLKELASSFRVIHQTGIIDIAAAESKKKELPKEIAENYLPSAFIENDFQKISEADLIISRASSSIFEFAAFAKPVILIPYPYASLDHQLANAKYFSNHNAATVLVENDLSPAIIYSTISKILFSDKRKKELGENLAKSIKLGGEKIIINELSKYMRK